MGVCVCVCARVSGREVVRKVYVMFVVYYCIHVASAFSFWNKEFLDLTSLKGVSVVFSQCYGLALAGAD